MKITVDTNVLISATFWYGSSDKIISKVEAKEIQLILSKEIIEEYTRVLNYKEIQDKIKDKKLEMIRTVKKIISISTLIVPKEKIDVVKEDPPDNRILECALACNAKYIIIQDKHLLKLKEFKGIRILTPKEFLRILC